jgi:hypothetical protein
MMTFRENLEEGEIDMIEFADILIKVLPAEQLDAILQEITSRYENDCCPICGSERMAVDKKSGKTLGYMDDVSDAEWHEMHEIDCPVALIEEMRLPKQEK